MSSHPLDEWLDLAAFEQILQSFSQLTGFASALVDNQNQILIAAGWQELCAEFHRANPRSEQLCKQSNQELFLHLSPTTVCGERCAHGLWDYAAPIIVDGEKIASVFVGQLFHEPPQEDFYRQYAQTFGFDEQAYLKALQKVPLVPKEKMTPALSLIIQIAQNFAALAKERKQLLETLKKQQLAEQELAKTSAFYRAALERIEAVTYIDAIDETSSSIYVSPQIENMFGYPVQEWFSEPDFWFKLIHPDDLEQVQQEHRRTNQSGEPFDMEYRMLAKDSRVVWVRDRAVINRDEHGNPLFWIGTFEDITQKKLAEETLRQEKIRNEALLHLYQLSDKPLEELADYFLTAALKITQSQIGFLGFINEDESTMTIYAWSKEAQENCQIQDQPQEFSIANSGLWAEALRQRKPFILNDYHDDHPHKKGYPEGHLPIDNFMGVPLNDGERIVMLVGLSNKPSAYTAEDAHQLTLLMSGLWTMLQRKQAEEALQERLLKLISPNTQLHGVTLEDLFDIQELQAIQDAFSEATGVASLITDVIGRPITQPSHFCRLCKDVIRKTDIGLQHCMAFDAEIGTQSKQGFNMLPCACGLWNSSTPIMVGNRHIANWQIGQVLDETANEEKLLAYADEIGANQEEYRQALKEVPRMSADKFKKISAALHLIAKQLSRLAAQNVQQAQFIAERQRVEETLAQERTILRTLINQIPDAIYVKDQYARKTLSNATDLFFMGLKEEAEVLGKTDFDFFPREIAEQFYADDMRVLQQGEAVINKEEVTQDIHGEKRYLLTTKVPIRDKEGNIIRLVGIGRDITERKKAEDALIRERNLLRDLLINAPDTIFIKDRQSRFVLCNPTLAKRHGFNNPEDLIGKTDFDIHEQSLAAQFFAEEQHVMDTCEPFFNREQFYRDGITGELCWVSSTKVPWRNENGEIIGIIGINRDITEQKKIEELIQREHNLLRALIDSAIDQVFVKDKQGRFVLCNPATVKSLGKNRLEEVIGKTDFDFFPKDLAERFYAEEQLIFQSAQPLVNREAKIIDESGNVRWISTNKVSWRNEYGEVIGLVGINRDITEQKLAQEALFRERHLLQAIVNGTPDQIYAKDRNSRFILCNPATAYAMGFSDPSQLIGKWDFDFHTPENAQKFLAEEKAIMESGKPMVNVERLEKLADGKEHWLSVTKVPLYDEHGEIFGTVGINRDITEVKKAEQEVRKLNAELEQRVMERTAQLTTTIRELEDFAYAVSHDLRTPLRGINGFSQALIEDYGTALESQAVNYLERIRKASQRMGQIIDDLLKISRVTRANLVRIPINLSQIAESFLQEMQLIHPERKIEVIIKPDVIVEADPNLMRMALTNLLDNAWKFTAPKPYAVIEFGETVQNGEQVFFVRDNGVGFDMAYVNKIFGAFQRLHHISEFEGTGIGLATVYRVIQRHGGRVWAESALDQGTTIFFTL